MKFKVSSIEGNRQLLDGGSMFGNAPRQVWQKWIKPDEKHRIPLACRCLLIETENLKILCETGIGAFFEPKLAERFGVQDPEKHLLLENLKKQGVTEEDIDYVILSHLHFDHAGGLMPTWKEKEAGEDALKFPKARYVVGQEAFERAEKPHSRDRASFIPTLVEKLKASGRLIKVKGNHLPGVLEGSLSFLRSSGHTPGQLHSLLKGAQNSVFYAGDLIPGRHWVHLPITMGYDRYPEKLINEKKEIYERAVSEKWFLFYTHDDEISSSQVEKNEKGRFIPAHLQKEWIRFSL